VEFEKRVLRRIFCPKREREWQKVGEDCIMRGFISGRFLLNLITVIKTSG
jgi:hypothetical protein